MTTAIDHKKYSEFIRLKVWLKQNGYDDVATAIEDFDIDEYYANQAIPADETAELMNTMYNQMRDSEGTTDGPRNAPRRELPKGWERIDLKRRKSTT